VASLVNEDGFKPPGGISSDDLGGHHGEAGGFFELKELPQPGMGGSQLAVEVVLHPEIVKLLLQTGVFFPEIYEAEISQPRFFHGL
jgi:hypothetical protein